MRRSVIAWSVVFAVLLAAFAVTVLALNGTVYSAGGFVRGYLDALSRKDTVAALEIPGVRPASDADATFLTAAALGDLDHYDVVSDTAGANGARIIGVEYTLGDTQHSTEFEVTPQPARFALFSNWRFQTSPLTAISVTVLNDQDFEINGVEATSSAQPNQPSSYLVFTPGLYELGHTSTFLTAAPVELPVTSVGVILDATVDVQANDEFVEKIQSELAGFLDECATQTVLMPTGCPFGQQIANRVVSQPSWSIADYPTAAIVPGITYGTWAMPPTEGMAQLTVDVQSLFDGTVSARNDEVPFTVEYLIEFRAGNTLVITAVPTD